MEAFDLLGGRLSLVKIPHQANADGLVVEEAAGKVTAIKLAFPPVSSLNLSIRHSAPVPDNKVIGKPIFHSALFAMIAVHAS